jgi:hypothetical protein
VTLTGRGSRSSAGDCGRGRSAYSEISKNCDVPRRNCNALWTTHGGEAARLSSFLTMGVSARSGSADASPVAKDQPGEYSAWNLRLTAFVRVTPIVWNVLERKGLVNLDVASWNQIGKWLRRVEALRDAA